jgi:hypothetical protein
MAALIENCIRAQQDPNWVKPMMKGVPRPFDDQFYILNTTGPGMVTRTYAERPDLAGAVTILFPEDVRDPATWHQFGEFGVHHMAGSWRKPKTFWSLRITRLWEGWMLRRILSQSRGRGKTRGLPAEVNRSTRTGNPTDLPGAHIEEHDPVNSVHPRSPAA